ncbi:VOC family protein [Leptothoe spongobia]|uniref:VOC family protein n=1 Tax=Leptothoe spongobia TAU-MAC 1115 TaxID=1967444 RepID=A0A947GHT1_9CYAN|nr:VOC family protein [Leptothoe spongobia]MBT9314337.1 VOC family protein [Leptothoe spongobia TAU-MAC 1115]
MQTNNPIPSSLHLKRPCLLVADLERSLTLYRDCLGFKLDYVGNADPDSYLYPVFQLPAAAQLRFAALSTQEEPRALALTEVKGSPLPPPPKPHRGATVIRVPSLASVLPQLATLGLCPITASSFSTPPNLTFTEQAVCDFDGHLIVLYEVQRSSTS